MREEALRALVSKWRQFADELRAAPDGGFLAVRDATRLRMCADELEAALRTADPRGEQESSPTVPTPRVGQEEDKT